MHKNRPFGPRICEWLVLVELNKKQCVARFTKVVCICLYEAQILPLIFLTRINRELKLTCPI